MSEGDLSDKIRLEYLTLDIEEDVETEEELILIKDVKEFIKKLKENYFRFLEGEDIYCAIEIIDELAGDELI